mgnify:CR=1 FL=1
MRMLLNITVQEKSRGEDYRAFAHVVDESGDQWELRGYGPSPGEAADDAFRAYLQEDWSVHGYVVTRKIDCEHSIDTVEVLEDCIQCKKCNKQFGHNEYGIWESLIELYRASKSLQELGN